MSKKSAIKVKQIMVPFKLRIEITALALLLLTGCAANNYWQPDPALFGIKPTEIALIENDDPSVACRAAPLSVVGCAVMHPQANLCTVHVKSRVPQAARSCIVTHEMRHCFGDNHLAFTGRPHYSIDCGNGEFYGGALQTGG